MSKFRDTYLVYGGTKEDRDSFIDKMVYNLYNSNVPNFVNKEYKFLSKNLTTRDYSLDFKNFRYDLDCLDKTNSKFKKYNSEPIMVWNNFDEKDLIKYCREFETTLASNNSNQTINIISTDLLFNDLINRVYNKKIDSKKIHLYLDQIIRRLSFIIYLNDSKVINLVNNHFASNETFKEIPEYIKYNNSFKVYTDFHSGNSLKFNI